MKYIYIPIYARNVWFTPDAELYLLELSNRVKSEKVKKWIKSNLRNYLTNDFKLAKITRNTKLPDTAPDWLKQKRGTEAIYILTQDNLKKKTFPIDKVLDYLDKELSNENIYKMSVPDVVEKYSKWKKNKSSTTGDISEKKLTGVRLVEKLSNGYSWYQVTGRQALINEGKMMQHCLQKDGYYNSVKAGRIQIFSLRNSKSGQSHVTIEYDKNNNEIKQIKGKQNEVPAIKYRQAILDFINKNNYKVGNDCFDFSGLGATKLDNGQYVFLSTYNGNLDIKEGPLTINSKILQRDDCDFPSISGYYVTISGMTISTEKIKSYTLNIEGCTCNKKLIVDAENKINISHSDISSLEIINAHSVIQINSSNISITAKNIIEVVDIKNGMDGNVVKFDNKIKIRSLVLHKGYVEYTIIIGNNSTIDYIKTIPDNVKLILGNNCKIGELGEPDSLSLLPNELQILGDLTIDGKKLPESIGSNIRVNGTLLVLHSDIIPKDVMNKIKSIKCTKLVMEK